MTKETKDEIINSLVNIRTKIADYIPQSSMENNAQMKAIAAIEEAEQIIINEFRYSDDRQCEFKSETMSDEDEPMSPFDE